MTAFNPGPPALRLSHLHTAAITAPNAVASAIPAPRCRRASIAIVAALGGRRRDRRVPATPIAQQPQEARIEEVLARVQDTIIRLREHIHQYPELGNREFKTAELVANHLRSLGFDEVETGIAHTGVVGILRGGLPGPVVAVRADMDALPVTEFTPYPFRSTVRTTYLGQEVGVSHACGHDIHVAVQLGVASVLASMRDEIRARSSSSSSRPRRGPRRARRAVRI